MSFDLTVLKQFALAGKNFSHQQTLSKGGMEGVEQLIPVAQAGTLSTRTDANTGILTMDSEDHGIETGNKIDLYWDGGSRRGVTVGTVDGDSVPIDLGAGDNLPDEDTVVQAAVVQVYEVSINGDDVVALVAAADSSKCTIVLMSGGDAAEELAIVLAANGAYGWTTSDGDNPIDGDSIDAVHMTIADTSTPRYARMAALLDI